MNPLRGRPLPLLALGAGVLAVHLWVVDEVAPPRLGEGAAAAQLRRFEVSFVRELAPTAPPAVAPRAAAPRPRRVAAAPARPASAAEPPEPAPPPPAEPAEPLLAAAPPDPLPAPPELAPPLPEPAASAPEPPASAASAASPAFAWPPSTRIDYRLTGNARGPIDGYARVEWLRSGNRYQVFMEASVGPPFAPLFTRRDTSEGEITAEGLSPRRYELESKAVLRDPRRAAIVFEPTRVRLPSGQELARPPGVQDSVSQFVHMTWLFTMHPELLAPGRSIELMLALPRRIEPWTYDVVAIDRIETRAGPVEALHVKPRRDARPGSDYVAEVWIAPSLQYLPVRIVVRQDAETFVDMQIERLPQQAEPGR